MLEAVRDDFSMSADETMIVAQISSGACLLVVFLVVTLADRVGDRRMLNAACITFGIGALIVGLAPNAGALLLGQSIGGVGTISLSIIGLSILNKNFAQPQHRARAFGMFAVIAPIVAIVLPLVSSAIVTHFHWRGVTLVWVVLSVVALAMARRALPAHGGNAERLELVTPGLAGVALAGIALTFSFIRADARTNEHAMEALLCAVISVMAIAVLVATMRKHPKPTFDIRSLRERGAIPIVMAVFLVNSVNLFFFTYLILQYRYHQSLLETAVFLILPQITATFGAVMGGRLSAQWGSTQVATTALLGASLISMTALFVSAESSPWIPVLVLSIAAIPIAAAVGPITQSFMDLAPRDGQGATSSMRNSAVNLGIAIGGLFVGTIIFDEIDTDTERNLVAYRLQVDAFHDAGLFCFFAYLGAAVLLMLHHNRRNAFLFGK